MNGGYTVIADLVPPGQFTVPPPDPPPSTPPADRPTKQSGTKEQFATGSQRDTQNGKARYDLIPLEPLRRLAALYAKGAAHYGDNNWRLGQPNSRVYASLLRHVFAWAEGDNDEDHLAAVAWNAFALMYNENRPELDDMDETVRS